MVVGVRRVTSSGVEVVGDADEAVVSVGQHWVTVDGVPIPGVVMGVEWGATETAGLNMVTVTLACGSFRTTDRNGPESPSRGTPGDPLADGDGPISISYERPWVV